MTSAGEIHGAAYYADYGGEPYERNGKWLQVFDHFADRIVTHLAPTKVLDAGCAIGLLVERLRHHGVESYGFDVSEYAISQVPEEYADFCWVASLTEPIKDRYDLITCIEVIEHLPEVEASDAVATLCAATDRVLLSSTPDEHEEPTHFNVQPPEYWTALFARQGFERDLEFDATFISPWAALYRRSERDHIDTIRTYDRSWWRQKTENRRLRAALLDTTRQRDELRAAPQEATEETSRDMEQALAEAQAQVATLEAAVLDAERRSLMMRDELIGATTQLGHAAGRAAELQAEVAALAMLRPRYEEVVGSTTWRLAWRVLTPYRVLRTRAAGPYHKARARLR